MIALVAALGLVLSTAFQAEESLADKAARARRTAAPASARANPPKVYKNEDLLTAKGTVIIAAEPEGQPETAPDAGATGRTAKPEPSEEEKRAQAGAALQKQIDEQTEVIQLSRKAIEESEWELADLTNYTFGTRRAALMQSVEDARQAMAAAQRAIADLEDQARHQGVRVSVP